MRNKHIQFVIIILVLLWGGSLKAQIIKGEIIAGTNLSQVDGDMFYGYKKFGMQAGAGAMIPFGNWWDVSVEALYNQKGARQRSVIPDTVCLYDYKLRLNYAEVPVLVHYTDKEFITAGAGFSWGRLVGVSEWENGEKTEVTTKSGTYTTDDFNIIGEVRIRIKGPLKFNVRYAYSIFPLRSREFTNCDTFTKFTRQQYNNLLTFRLVYMFGEKRSRENFQRARSESK